jgi:peptidoglycan biosynthesis protein MviN/MurJ (putative lipid II flippase)
LALSNSLATTVEMVVLLGIIRQRLGGLEGRRTLASLSRIGLASLLMGAVAGALAWLLRDQGAWLEAGVAITVGLVEYVAASLALRSPEPWAVWNMIARRGQPAAQMEER